MIVVDASVVVDVLLLQDVVAELAEIVSDQVDYAAPNLLEYEVGSVLRRQNIKGALTDERAKLALEDFGNMELELYPLHELSERVWQLRKNMTYYDASYVALAEMLNVPFYTRDKRLASAPGHSATIILI